MKSRFVARISLVFAASLFPLSLSLANELPPTDSKPLSLILKSVEEQKIGSITEAEFDDGLWEIKVCGATACEKLYLDPKTGNEKRRGKTDFDEAPPANAIPVSTTIQSIEAHGMGTITEVELEHGAWKVELRKDKQKMKLIADPISGEIKH
ncbi:MAG: PepSY domain-containing protein [Methylobacillus sp.]|jgi:uncharacterized membrane protein YkoI|nr:PepSY domain-containing protein [Methylobacillus sp.]